MYSTGDLIIYGNNGVCRVECVAEREIGGEKRMFYSLKPLYQSCRIMTPVENPKVYMRPVISREEANRLIDLIPNMKAEIFQSKVTRELAEHYDQAIKMHDCEELINLTMSIYAKKKLAESEKRKFGSIDERFLKRAEELLFGEFAAALGIAPSEVQDYIDNRIGGKIEA